MPSLILHRGITRNSLAPGFRPVHLAICSMGIKPDTAAQPIGHVEALDGVAGVVRIDGAEA